MGQYMHLTFRRSLPEILADTPPQIHLDVRQHWRVPCAKVCHVSSMNPPFEQLPRIPLDTETIPLSKTSFSSPASQNGTTIEIGSDRTRV